MILWALTFLDPTFLEPRGVVIVKKHSKPCGPLMATGSWSSPRLPAMFWTNNNFFLISGMFMISTIFLSGENLVRTIMIIFITRERVWTTTLQMTNILKEHNGHQRLHCSLSFRVVPAPHSPNGSAIQLGIPI